MTRERRRAEDVARTWLSDRGFEEMEGDVETLADEIADALLAERQRATRSALDGLARWARDPGWCLCSEGIAVGHHRKAVCVATEIERRAREARARGEEAVMKCPGCGTDLLDSVGYWSRGGGLPRVGLMEATDDAREHTPARCTAARLTTAEVEVLRGLMALGERLDGALSEMAVYQEYGHMRTADPRDFEPDVDECTPEEIENHRLAVEAVERGEPVPEQPFTPDAATYVNGVMVHSCGGPWGIGCYTIRDPEMIELRDAARNALPLIARLVEARDAD